MGDKGVGSVAYMPSVAMAQAADFANLPNKIGKVMEKIENVDKARGRGVFCQH
jgi:hypothetical protein